MRSGRELGRSRAAGRAGRRKKAARAKVEHPFLYVKRRFGYVFGPAK